MCAAYAVGMYVEGPDAVFAHGVQERDAVLTRNELARKRVAAGMRRAHVMHPHGVRA